MNTYPKHSKLGYYEYTGWGLFIPLVQSNDAFEFMQLKCWLNEIYPEISYSDLPKDFLGVKNSYKYVQTYSVSHPRFTATVKNDCILLGVLFDEMCLSLVQQ